MPITWVGGAQGREGTNLNDITLPWPAGHQAGDVAVAFMGSAAPGAENAQHSIATAGWGAPLREDGAPLSTQRGAAVWAKRATSGAEPAVVFQTNTAVGHSAGLLVFRGVDPSIEIDAATVYDNPLDIITADPPGIVTATDNAATVLYQLLTHGNDITPPPVPPAGYTLGPYFQGGNRADFVTAYLLDAGPAGVEDPTAWQHNNTNNTRNDNILYTVALREEKAASGPVIDSVVPAIPWDNQVNVSINGSGFGSTEGTVTYGGIPLTVTNWTDTQITANWAKISDPGSTLGFNVNHTLEVLVAS